MNWERDDFDEHDEDPPSTYYSERHYKIVYRNFFDFHWVSAHEFGHALQNEKLGGLWDHDCRSPHFVDKQRRFTPWRVDSRTCRNSGGKRNDTAAPRNPSSTRPSGWDADDIRKTWIQSVG